ncbi:MAG: nucleoside recognition protein [Rikenellaceae bacterium]
MKESNTPSTTFCSRLLQSSYAGFLAGARTWWWISKITVITTFLVTLLQWSGLIGVISEVTSDFFALFGLSTEGVIIFMTTALANIYAGIGVMATLVVDFREATLLAVMGLICHNLIVETIIQRKSGASATGMILLRISAALIAATAMNWILPDSYSGELIIERAAPLEGVTLSASLATWALNMLHLIPLMLLVIGGLNTIQQILREFNVIDLISKPFAPLMALFGLRADSSLIWLILNTLGLAYGGSIMITQRKEDTLSLKESRLLNTHIAVSHSLLEDTLLYFALGLSLFWLMVPRLILAIVAVWVQRLYGLFRSRRTTKIKGEF